MLSLYAWAVGLLAILLPITALNAADPTLIAHWKFDEGNGSTTADASGNGHTATLNGPTWVRGVTGTGLSFDATNDYVQIGMADQPLPWTCAVWVNRQAATLPSSRILNSSAGCLKLEQYLNTKKVGFTQQTVADYTFNYQAPLGTWVHLAFVATSSGTSLYVNGALVDSRSEKISLPLTEMGHVAEPLSGAIDEMMIYSRALSATEIQALSSPLQANNGVLAATEDTAVAGTLTSNTSGVTYSIVSNGLKGFAAITDPATGVFTYTPNLDANGVDTFTFNVSNGILTSNTATTTVTINPVNDPPSIVSGLTATPNLAGVGQLVTFTAVAADADNDVLTFVWDFADGGVGSGNVVAHSYSTPGIYDASVIVIDPVGSNTSAKILITVVVPAVGSGKDSDGDGFSDEIEAAAGSSATDALSTPFEGRPPGTTQPLNISKFRVKLNFIKTIADAIDLSGTLPLGNDFQPEGQRVTLAVGGVITSFQLSTKGSAFTGHGKFSLSRAKSGTARFAVKLSKGDFAPALKASGLLPENASKKALSVDVTLLFDRTVFQKTEPILYSARIGKAGVARSQQ